MIFFLLYLDELIFYGLNLPIKRILIPYGEEAFFQPLSS